MMMETARRLTERPAERFSRLAMPLVPVMLRVARCLVGRAGEAEDLVQEAMIKALRGMDGFTEGTDIKAWLMTILRRTHIDMIRSRKRYEAAVAEKAEAALREEGAGAGSAGNEQGAAGTDVGTETDEWAGAYDGKWREPGAVFERFGDEEVIAALKALPEEIRWTLLLVDVEGLEQSAAAEILEVPVGTIKSRAHRGRAMLRDRLYEWAQERGWVVDEESSHA